MLLDKLVDAAGVGFHDGAGFLVEQSSVAFGGGAEAESAEAFVYGNGNGAEDFRELATSNAAEEVHLPETVLRHDVALGFRHIGERGCADVRDAPDVAVNGDLILQAGQRGCAVHLRERAKKKPPCKAATDESEKCQKPT
jgi:hypothetical protein